MRVTAIIPTIERTRPYLELCVKSLRATVDWDIVVVSNGSPNAYPLNPYGITRRLHTKDQGQCLAVNNGAAISPNTDYYFVANDDMYFAPSWTRYLRFEYPVFSPNLVEPTDNAGSAPPFMKLDGGLTLEAFKREAVNRYVDVISDLEHDKETAGFNLPFFVRRDVWETVGGYDPKYDPWGSNSDTDLQTKFELAGITPRRQRDMLVYHFGSKSGTFEADKQAYWQRNWDYYTRKWGFNRDQLGSDPWMCRDMIDYKRLTYNPRWMRKYQ